MKHNASSWRVPLKNNERLDIDALVEGVISLDDLTKEGFVG